MKIVGLHNIERKPLAVEYRRLYKADAEITAGSATCTTNIEFSLEMSAFGTYEISVRFLDSPDFPVVPAVNLLRETIAELNRNRELP